MSGQIPDTRILDLVHPRTAQIRDTADTRDLARWATKTGYDLDIRTSPDGSEVTATLTRNDTVWRFAGPTRADVIRLANANTPQMEQT